VLALEYSKAISPNSYIRAIDIPIARPRSEYLSIRILQLKLDDQLNDLGKVLIEKRVLSLN
jgi:hypothetical protein